MPETKVVFFKEDDGTVPALYWLDSLSQRAKVRAKVKRRLRIERLKELGRELRRPEADYLRDGIYELRVRLGHVNYRILYFFYGNQAAVLSHGLVKERRVPSREINKAIERKVRFTQNPEKHTWEEI